MFNHPERDAMTDLALFDLSQLDAMTGGDHALAAEVIDIFRTQADVWALQLDPAAPARQWADTAHTLKGAALSIGAMKLAKLCETAERAGRAETPPCVDEAAQLLTDVKIALNETLAAAARAMNELTLKAAG